MERTVTSRKLFICFCLLLVSQAYSVEKMRKVRGVSLGGWLVVEAWIKHSLFDDIPNPDMLDGTEVQFKSVVSQNYITALEGGGENVTVNNPVHGAFETFRLWRVSETQFQFRSSGGQFLSCVGERCTVSAKTESPSSSETFIIEKFYNRVHFRTLNGTYIQSCGPLCVLGILFILVDPSGDSLLLHSLYISKVIHLCFMQVVEGIHKLQCFLSRRMSILLQSRKLMLLLCIMLLKNNDTDYRNSVAYKRFGEFGFRTLNVAASNGNADIIPLLVANGADVNAPSKVGTPLNLASQKNKRNAFKSLLDNGANPNLKDDTYGTILGSTLSKNSTDFTELLLKAGADPNAIIRTKTPLGFADAEGKLPFIKLLLKYKADPNIADKVEWLPIEHAAFNSNRMELRALLLVTQPILACSDWSVKGIINYVNSQEVVHKRSSMIKKNNSIARAKGDDAFEREDYHEANQHYTEAIAYDPCDATAHARKSSCLGYLDNSDGCLEFAKVCLTLRPDWPEAYFILGAAYHGLEDFDKAAEVLYWV